VESLVEVYKRMKKPCPPHVPIAVLPIEASFAATCLKCGIRGPIRADYEEARLAFYEFQKNPLRLVKGIHK
jgi:hypothetical protein